MTDLVEKVAEALATAEGTNWNATDFRETSNGCEPEEDREHYRHLARAAIAVTIEACAEVCDAQSLEYMRGQSR